MCSTPGTSTNRIGQPIRGASATRARLAAMGTAVSSTLCTTSVGGRTAGGLRRRSKRSKSIPIRRLVTRGANGENPGGSRRLRACWRSVARQSTSGASQTTAATAARARAVQERPDDRPAHGPAEQHEPVGAPAAGELDGGLQVGPLGVAEVVVAVRAGRGAVSLR